MGRLTAAVVCLPHTERAGWEQGRGSVESGERRFCLFGGESVWVLSFVARLRRWSVEGGSGGILIEL